MQRRGYRMERKLTGLRRQRSGSRIYIYHRATGIRMPDLPEDHPDFLRAYLAAEEGATPTRRGRPRDGSLEALVLSAMRSDRYAGLSEGYRAIIRRNADRILERGATVPVKQLRERHVTADLQGLAPHPANERLKTWRFLISHAIETGQIPDSADPTRGIRKRATPKARQHPPWSAADVAAFRGRWPLDSSQRLAFEILHWTGARISSALTLGPGMIDQDGWLHFVQSKTDGPVWIPFSRRPPDFADPADLAQMHAAIEARPQSHMVWITTSAGRPRSHKAVSSWFARAAREAGIDGGKSAHGLRVTRAIKLAEAGATAHQIGAWTGHEPCRRSSITAARRPASCC